MLHLVAVYGTLRHDMHNNCLLGDSEFIGGEIKRGNYAMYVDTYLPFVTKTEEDNHLLAYEVYKVTDETLARLDRLEGHPNWYCRELIPTSFGDAWMYLVPNSEVEGLTYVQHGDFAYKSNASSVLKSVQ